MIWKTRPRSERRALAAIEQGTGPLVVLLHGVGLRAEAWNAQIDALSQRYHVLAIDLPGHGISPAPKTALALFDYTDAIEKEIEGAALVVGHSMGAMIALNLAALYPQKVSAVVALNAVFQRSPEAATAVQARAATLDGVTSADPIGTLDRWFGAASSLERDACDCWLREVNPFGYKVAYSEFAHSTVPDARSLARLECAALFMTGALDPNSTPEMSKAMAEIAPRGRARIVEGAAHMMPMTHPEAVNRAILDLAEEVWP